jgi:hypothetical protein
MSHELEKTKKKLKNKRILKKDKFKLYNFYTVLRFTSN